MPKCYCGSGLESTWQYDARGIPLCRTCDKCNEEKMSQYRPEVLTDSNYECDEQIEPDE
jgi:hypothetical protein